MGRRRSVRYNRGPQRRPKAIMNEKIRAEQVRVIGNDGENLGVVPLEKGIELAKEAGKDLILITAKANPPVARIMDMGKFLYQKSKEEKKKKQQQKTQELKSIRIKLGTDTHDKQIKAKKIDAFLEDGNPVEVRIFLRGREKGNKDFAKKRLVEFTDLISVPFKVTMEPKYVGNGFSMQIVKDANAGESD